MTKKIKNKKQSFCDIFNLLKFYFAILSFVHSHRAYFQQRRMKICYEGEIVKEIFLEIKIMDIFKTLHLLKISLANFNSSAISPFYPQKLI